MKSLSNQTFPVLYKIIKMSHTYHSSFRFNTLTPFDSDDYRKAKHIIGHIMENPESLQFREPVKWQQLNLLDYPQLIKDPMDLGTILTKLNEERYENIQEFLDDFELIWDNCKNYNVKGTWIYGLADKLEKNGKKMLKNYFPSIPIQSIKTLQLTQNNPFTAQPSSQELKSSKKVTKTEKSSQLYYQDEEEITLAEKTRLADKFRLFSPSQNKELVEYIQSVCPTAFREYEERVQIVVDNMDIITFKQVLQYLMSYFRKSEEIEEKEKEEGYPSKKVKVQ